MEEIAKQYKISVLHKIWSKKPNNVFDLAVFYGVKRDQCGLIRDTWKHQILDKVKCALNEMQLDGFITYDEKGNDFFNFQITNKGYRHLYWYKIKKILYWILFSIPVALGGWITIITTMKGFFDAK